MAKVALCCATLISLPYIFMDMTDYIYIYIISVYTIHAKPLPYTLPPQSLTVVVHLLMSQHSELH